MGECSASRHVLDKIKKHVAASLRAAQLNSINAKATPNELISGSNDVNGNPINFHSISSTPRVPRVLPPSTKDTKHSLPTPPGSPHDLTLSVPRLPVPPPWPTSGLHQSSSSSTVTKSLDFLPHVNSKSFSSSNTTIDSSSSTALRTNSQFAPSSVVVGGHHVHQQNQRQHHATHHGTVSQVVVANSETVGPSAALGGPTVPSPLSGLSLITQQHHHHQHHPDLESPIIARALASSMPKRPRGEKHPIPEEQKDDKYFERRKRNNQAAKKSRDARKLREDEIAFRANLLEKENAILRAQVSTLREEANSLRQLLIQKRHSRFQVV